MTVRESQIPDKMLSCAREMYEAFTRNMLDRAHARGHSVNRIIEWSNLSQEVRDDWCAATVAAFQFVARGASMRSLEPAQGPDGSMAVRTWPVQPIGFVCDVCGLRRINPDAEHSRDDSGQRVFKNIHHGYEQRRCDECRDKER